MFIFAGFIAILLLRPTNHVTPNTSSNFACVPVLFIVDILRYQLDDSSVLSIAFDIVMTLALVTTFNDRNLLFHCCEIVTLQANRMQLIRQLYRWEVARVGVRIDAT